MERAGRWARADPDRLGPDAVCHGSGYGRGLEPVQYVAHILDRYAHDEPFVMGV